MNVVTLLELTNTSSSEVLQTLKKMITIEEQINANY